jgi:alanyl-tRNA synthetase
LTSDEIRAAFLSFFAEKAHKVISSSSLVPVNDPTLLLTTAGMVQIKPYFLGEEVPPAPRLASCQKCFRTTDITSVGDANHLTFFEMLGNFSVGDYFKREAIVWAWEFVTKRLALPPEKLWITIFLDDDESFRIWREIGIPENKILRYGEKDNFWGPAGDSGPCGPCSEIHYDLGPGFGCGKETCHPSCGCGRFSEVWNLVFTQYNQDKKGNRTLLAKPNIDTGMGLERITSVVQGQSNVYGTDLFAPLLERVVQLTGKKYGVDRNTDSAMRIVAEHSRGITFLIADGVIPANEGRGYVLRRVLRRAALFGKRLGLDRPFIGELAAATIAKMGSIYPEIAQRRDFIFKVILNEETRFRETLSTGLELLENILAGTADNVRRTVTGAEAFKLYDTYGFPVELTVEIAAGRGFAVDMEGFNLEMEKQRQRAREEHKFVNAAAETGYLDKAGLAASQFVGYGCLVSRSAIVHLTLDNKPVDEVSEGQEAGVVLESTPFYAEMGGQVGDTGEIRHTTGRFIVNNTVRTASGVVVHQGKVTGGRLAVGEVVDAQVDTGRRLDIARNHTATHLLQASLRRVLGEHVQQRGSLVAPERFRFDFSHLTAPTGEELTRVEQIVNELVRQDLRVDAAQMPYKKAIAAGVTALFGEKYGEVVRVIGIGEPRVSAELCGGTHIETTGQIGLFHIVNEGSIGAGLRRIEAVTGRGAETYITQRLADWQEVARAVGGKPEETREKVAGLLAELETERKKRQGLESELARRTAESLLDRSEVIKGVTIIIARVSSLPLNSLREMSDFLRDRLKSAVIVLGTVNEDRPAFLAVVTADLVARGYDAGKIVREAAKVTGGGGGGKPNLAQAGGKDKGKLDEALESARRLLQKWEVKDA